VVVSDIVVVVMKSAEMRVSSVDTMLERCHRNCSLEVVRLALPLPLVLVEVLKRHPRSSIRLLALKSPRSSDLSTRGMLSFYLLKLRVSRLLVGISRPALIMPVLMVGLVLWMALLAWVEVQWACPVDLDAAIQGSTPSLNSKHQS